MPRKVAAQQLELETAAILPPVKGDMRAGTPATIAVGARIAVVEADGSSAPKQTASRPSAAELLETPGALLTRSDLRGLGLERRAIDAVFRALPVVALPGYSRPMVRAEQYLELVEQHTYRDDRVRPCHA